jgi:hypothetical protein
MRLPHPSGVLCRRVGFRADYKSTRMLAIKYSAVKIGSGMDSAARTARRRVDIDQDPPTRTKRGKDGATA